MDPSPSDRPEKQEEEEKRRGGVPLPSWGINRGPGIVSAASKPSPSLAARLMDLLSAATGPGSPAVLRSLAPFFGWSSIAAAVLLAATAGVSMLLLSRQRAEVAARHGGVFPPRAVLIAELRAKPRPAGYLPPSILAALGTDAPAAAGGKPSGTDLAATDPGPPRGPEALAPVRDGHGSDPTAAGRRGGIGALKPVDFGNGSWGTGGTGAVPSAGSRATAAASSDGGSLSASAALTTGSSARGRGEGRSDFRSSASGTAHVRGRRESKALRQLRGTKPLVRRLAASETSPARAATSEEKSSIATEMFEGAQPVGAPPEDGGGTDDGQVVVPADGGETRPYDEAATCTDGQYHDGKRCTDNVRYLTKEDSPWSPITRSAILLIDKIMALMAFAAALFVAALAIAAFGGPYAWVSLLVYAAGIAALAVAVSLASAVFAAGVTAVRMGGHEIGVALLLVSEELGWMIKLTQATIAGGLLLAPTIPATFAAAKAIARERLKPAEDP